MTALDGAAAAVTGAASGIGRALADALAERGCHLALADRDAAGLHGATEAVRAKYPVTVTTTVLDVADAAAVERFAAEAGAAHPNLNIVVNNAGVALIGDHDQISLADLQWLMGINFWGVVYGCRAFMPQLLTQGEAHIINVSSVFGLVAPPGQTAYSSAKFAVRGFSEALRHELEERGGRIKVSTVYPGGIKTNIVRNARAVQALSNTRVELEDGFERMARSTPTQAAKSIVDGILANAPRILIGGDARLIDRLQRLMPTRYYAWLRWLQQRATGRATRPGAKATT
jgi:short-subunit dehydrogenase